MRAYTQVFVLSVIMVMSSFVYASCSVTTQSWPMSTFPVLVPISSWSQFQLVTCSQFQLVVKLYELIVTFPCIHFLHTFTSKTCHSRCYTYRILRKTTRILSIATRSRKNSMPISILCISNRASA